jgi:hypothetical protein
MVAVDDWFRDRTGLDGSDFPVRAWLARVNFWFGLILMVRLSGLIAGLLFGTFLAVNENWCVGFCFIASVMIGERIIDFEGWLLFGNEWSVNELSDAIMVWIGF